VDIWRTELVVGTLADSHVARFGVAGCLDVLQNSEILRPFYLSLDCTDHCFAFHTAPVLAVLVVLVVALGTAASLYTLLAMDYNRNMVL
jgi:hypothetical protein